MKKIVFIILILFLVTACSNGNTPDEGRIKIEKRIASALEPKKTFIETDNEICKQDGKPIIREFGTSWCPHCAWIEKTYYGVVADYIKKGKIDGHQWYIDIKDDLLTVRMENSVPESELEIFKKFNPKGSIPTFVFGCKYYRIGNGYEDEQDLKSEEAEFRGIIEKLISS